MSTLEQIAAGFGVQPIAFAILVGMEDVDPRSELSPEQIAHVINTADDSDFFGTASGGRHRFRLRLGC